MTISLKRTELLPERDTRPVGAATPRARSELHATPWLVLALFLGMAVATLYALALRTLVPPDEGRYAEMAREMWLHGDWITTRLNGIKYFEKPPLQTWMNALTFTAFGVGEWQARLWTGLCGLLGVVLAWYAGRRVFGARVGMYAGLVLGASLFWIVGGQINSLDMGVSGMMTLALCALLLAQHDDASARERRNWMLACWAGMALSVLAKGLIGVVLPGAVLVLYTLATRDWRLWTRLHAGKGLLLFFAIATPWFVLVGLRNPEQPHFFFIHEHWDRFFKDDHHRTGAWYYFVPALVLGVMPWLGALPQSLLAALRRRPVGARPGFEPKLLLLIWAGFIFFFFSYSSSKLPGYIVPIFPALALLLAAYLATAPEKSRMAMAGLVAATGGIAIVLSARASLFAKHVEDLATLALYRPYILATGCMLLLGGALALALTRLSRQRDLSVLALALCGFCSTHVLLAGFEPMGRERAGVALVPAIQSALKPGSTLYSVDTYEQSLPFYLGRTVTLVDYWDEFTFGLQQQPALSVPTLDAFAEVWRRHNSEGVDDVAIMSMEAYATLQQRHLPMRLLGQDRRRVVVASR